MTRSTPVHYLLLGLSGLLMFSLFVALVYLVFREKQKGKLARKQYLRSLLQKRRKAISGRPRGPEISFSDESTTEWRNTSPPLTPRHDTETRSSGLEDVTDNQMTLPS